MVKIELYCQYIVTSIFLVFWCSDFMGLGSKSLSAPVYVFLPSGVKIHETVEL